MTDHDCVALYTVVFSTPLNSFSAMSLCVTSCLGTTQSDTGCGSSPVRRDQEQGGIKHSWFRQPEGHLGSHPLITQICLHDISLDNFFVLTYGYYWYTINKSKVFSRLKRLSEISYLIKFISVFTRNVACCQKSFQFTNCLLYWYTNIYVWNFLFDSMSENNL